ncbi:uncharacterized protein N7473_001923 [Penicillium subrubescens]|jgi:hypothetical protein|uniref:Uncharacterized protein n=1 Tax=Penicillium subrubescens TaxID=1316194 RepID=A0A1Q5SR34_9EURO|nr:uncharacterized protein N7473_001923 [Penicillium subrubescens]KAJ5905007.1 hypothetical protein N7473_001923 [Penicillium subrubescens]OKO90345.1 hypothetical protein PENSUB_13478 [Penicillium subrubescens]
MSFVTGHLVRRGTELASAQFKDPEKQPEQISGALAACLALTVLVFGFAMWAVEYTYGGVVATLAAVEDSNPDVYVRIDNPPEEDPTKPFDPNEPELAAAARPQPVTSKLRTTIKHLRARAGFWSRFRGLAMYLTYGLARGIISSFLPSGSFITQFFVQSILSVLLSTWQMAWVHIVISEPSPKRFYQRIPSFRTWVKIAPAAALADVLTAAGFFLPMAIASFAGWLESNNGNESSMVAACRYLVVMGVPALFAFLISIPARVIFVRVAASMLPEEDETIVPFDRSFGGKVQPQIVGGSGHIGLLDAWTTFDWAARVRFAKVIGKTVAIEVALGLLAGILIFVQIITMAPNAIKHDGSAKPSPA